VAIRRELFDELLKDYQSPQEILRRESGLKKCDVLCVNCHAKRHWREMHKTDNWEEVMPVE
jgi:hypothetical protein